MPCKDFAEFQLRNEFWQALHPKKQLFQASTALKGACRVAGKSRLCRLFKNPAAAYTAGSRNLFKTEFAEHFLKQRNNIRP